MARPSSIDCNTLACENGSLDRNTLAHENGSLDCNTLACTNGPLDCNTLARKNGPLDCNTLARENGPLDCNTLARKNGPLDCNTLARKNGPLDCNALACVKTTIHYTFKSGDTTPNPSHYMCTILVVTCLECLKRCNYATSDYCWCYDISSSEASQLLVHFKQWQ